MLENYTFFHYIIFILDGLLVGFAAGLFSIGGGTAVVPVLTALLHYSQKIAVGISVMQMVFSSFYNSYLNYKKGNLFVKDGFACAIGGAIGGYLSGVILQIISDIFAAYLIILVLIWSIIKLYISPENPTSPEKKSIILQFILGLFIGMFSASAGIGGAAILIPALVGICNFNIKKASSTGSLYVLFVSSAAFISTIYHNNIDYIAGIIISISSLFGVKIGNFIFQKTTNKMQKKLFLGFLIFVLILAIYGLLREYGIFN